MPLLSEHDAALTLSDEMVLIGARYYIKATASLLVGANKFETTSFARESETKKGMDDSQITGAASSYARKYALNGLFCIDDTKDADTQDNTDNDELTPANTDTWNRAIDYYKKAGNLRSVLEKWTISDQNQKRIEDAAKQ